MCEHRIHDDLGILQLDAGDDVAEQLLIHFGNSVSLVAPKTVIVPDIYLPQIITELIRTMRLRRSKQAWHIMPGFAFDLTTSDPNDGIPWDFGLESKRDKARALLRAKSHIC